MSIKSKLIVLLKQAILVVLVLFSALNVLVYCQVHSMTHFASAGIPTAQPERLSTLAKLRILLTGITLPRPHGRLAPAEVGLSCNSETVGEQSGIKLGAWYCPTSDDAPLVLLFHGYCADKSSLLKEATLLHELGCATLLIDFRGSGDSSESYVTIGVREAEDVAAAVSFAETKYRYSRLVLFGRSMGAAAVLRALNRQTIHPDAIILEAVFDTLLNTVRNRFNAMGVPAFPSAQLMLFWAGWQFDFDAFSHNPVDYARQLSCPVLFLHGTADPRAQLDEARRVFAAAPAPKKFYEFSEVGHEDYAARFPDQWKLVVGNFLGELEKDPAR